VAVEGGGEKLHQHVINMDEMATTHKAIWNDHDAVFCCLGTTRSQVSSLFYSLYSLYLVLFFFFLEHV